MMKILRKRWFRVASILSTVIIVLVSTVILTNTVLATAIDVGHGAATGNGQMAALYTYIDKTNPADGDGVITSIQIQVANNTNNMRVGLFYLSSGTTYVCRSSVSLGAVTAGGVRTFDISATPMTVVTGDLMGAYTTTSSTVYTNSTGGSGRLYVSGEYIDPGDSASYSSTANYWIALYGIGIVAGGAVAPTVVTGSASSITTITVIISENVTATGGADVTSWGTYYGLTTSYGSTVTNNGDQASAFGWSDTLSSLQPATLYHYQGWATNSAGTGVGSDSTFTTNIIPRIEIW